MSNQLLGPPEGLVVPAGQESRFALENESWIQMVGFVEAAKSFPDFEAKYGNLAGNTTERLITNVKQVQALCSEFGDAKGLRNELNAKPGLMNSKTPPQKVYSHIVWIVNRLVSTARSIGDANRFAPDNLSTLPGEDQASNLRELLFDKNMGSIPLLNSLSDECGALVTKIGRFEQAMSKYIENLMGDTQASSKLMAVANQAIAAGDRNKQSLVADLTAFNRQLRFVLPAITGITRTLQTVQGSLVRMNADLATFSQNVNENNVGDSPFLEKSKVDESINDWRSVENCANQFQTQSLLDLAPLAPLAFGDAAAGSA